MEEIHIFEEWQADWELLPEEYPDCQLMASDSR
jgi:hypothetical protein